MKRARGSERIKRRITCELVSEGRRYRGIVLDLSETGVFVQTEATPAPGSRLRLSFHAGDGTGFDVEASVARRQVAPPQLATVVRGGLGLRVHAPPPAYFELMRMSGSAAAAAASGAGGSPAAPRAPSPAGAPGRAPAAAPAAPEPPPGDPFRVRVKQSSGPRSRTVEVRAKSPDEAARRALAELGSGWEVLRVERG